MTGYIKITILDNEIEAQLMEASLKQNEIPFMIRSYHDTAMDGLYQQQKGWGAVYAPEQYEDDILELLDAVRNRDSDNGDETPDADGSHE